MAEAMMASFHGSLAESDTVYVAREAGVRQPGACVPLSFSLLLFSSYRENLLSGGRLADRTSLLRLLSAVRLHCTTPTLLPRTRRRLSRPSSPAGPSAKFSLSRTRLRSPHRPVRPSSFGSRSRSTKPRGTRCSLSRLRSSGRRQRKAGASLLAWEGRAKRGGRCGLPGKGT